VAPWIPDRAGNAALGDALARHGGATTFWGLEDYVPLTSVDWDAHLADLPKKKRQRIVSDERRTAAADVTIERLDGDAIRPHVTRIAELTCLNREKNGAGEEPLHIETMLGALLDAGADVRTYLGWVPGVAEPVAACVSIRKGERLMVKWAGFDYSQVGERSGIYFAMMLNRPVRDAYAEGGLRTVEFGAGAHEAKQLRGCSSREVTTALWLADEALRPEAARMLAGFGAARRQVFGPEPTPAGPVLLPIAAASSGSACCSGG
jgi:predicted N-acyltransferase